MLSCGALLGHHCDTVQWTFDPSSTFPCDKSIADNELNTHTQNKQSLSDPPRFRALLDQQHSLSEKFATLENGNWQTHTGKQCASTKKVQNNYSSLKKLEMRLEARFKTPTKTSNIASITLIKSLCPVLQVDESSSANCCSSCYI